MRTIWKFTIPVKDGIIEVQMPENAQLLHVGMPMDMAEVWLWAIVESEAKKETRLFRVHGTGHKLANNAYTQYATYDKYVGTAYHRGLPLVWHIFEVKPSIP